MTCHDPEAAPTAIEQQILRSHDVANAKPVLNGKQSLATRRQSVLLVVRHPVGGIRTFFRYVFRQLPHQRYRFTLVAPDYPEARVILDDLGSLEFRFVPVDCTATNIDFFRAVAKLARAERFDLIYSHGFTAAISAVAPALLSRTPHLLTCHDVFTDAQFRGFMGTLKKIALGSFLATIDQIHCVTDDARANLLGFLPNLRPFSRKVLAIRNGIEVDRFANERPRNLKDELGLEPSSFLIGFLGRFMSQKGFRYLVDAFVEMQKRSDLPRRAIIVTISSQDGYYREEMCEVNRRGLSNEVLFLPFVPNVAPTLKGLDVVAIPSLWEACGLLAMEAMVAGVPVVGTSCIGLREVLADTPAKVVPPRDASKLAEALMAEMLAPTTRQAKEFAPVAAARFDVRRQAEELDRVIQTLLARHGARPV